MIPARDDRSTMLGTTLFWIGVVVFLGAGFVGQTPPGGPYTDLIRRAFAIFAGIAVAAGSIVVVLSWIAAARRD